MPSQKRRFSSRAPRHVKTHALAFLTLETSHPSCVSITANVSEPCQSDVLSTSTVGEKKKTGSQIRPPVSKSLQQCGARRATLLKVASDIAPKDSERSNASHRTACAMRRGPAPKIICGAADGWFMMRTQEPASTSVETLHRPCAWSKSSQLKWSPFLDGERRQRGERDGLLCGRVFSVKAVPLAIS